MLYGYITMHGQQNIKYVSYICAKFYKLENQTQNFTLRRVSERTAKMYRKCCCSSSSVGFDPETTTT